MENPQTNLKEDSIQDSLNNVVAETSPKPEVPVTPTTEVGIDDPKKDNRILLVLIALLAIVGIGVTLFVLFISQPAAEDTETNDTEQTEELDSDNFTLETNESISIDDEDQSSNEEINGTIDDLDTFFEDLEVTNDFEDTNVQYDE